MFFLQPSRPATAIPYALPPNAAPWAGYAVQPNRPKTSMGTPVSAGASPRTPLSPASARIRNRGGVRGGNWLAPSASYSARKASPDRSAYTGHGNGSNGSNVSNGSRRSPRYGDVKGKGKGLSKGQGKGKGKSPGKGQGQVAVWKGQGRTPSPRAPGSAYSPRTNGASGNGRSWDYSTAGGGSPGGDVGLAGVGGGRYTSLGREAARSQAVSITANISKIKSGVESLGHYNNGNGNDNGAGDPADSPNGSRSGSSMSGQNFGRSVRTYGHTKTFPTV